MEKDINTLYDEFVVDSAIQNYCLEDTKNYVVLCYLYLKDNIKELKSDIIKNNIFKNISKLIEKSIFFTTIYTEEFYVNDNKILGDALEKLKLFSDYIARLYNVASDNNYREVFKLLSFICTCQGEYADYVNYLRDKNECMIKKIDYSNSSKKFYTDISLEFFDEKIKCMTNKI